MALFPFDIHTLIALLFIGNLMTALILFAYRSGGSMDRTCRQFLLGKLLQALAWGLLALHGVIPDFYAIHVGNSLMLVGFAGEALAIVTAGRSQRRVEMGFAALAVGAILLFSLFDYTPADHLAITSLMTILLFGTAAALMLRQISDASRLHRLFGWVYGLFCVILALLAAVAELTPDEPTQTVRALAFLMLYLLMLTGGSGFLLLLKEQDDRRLKAAYDELTEREKRLHQQSLALDQIQDHVTVTDLNGIVTYVNRPQAIAFGIPPEVRIERHVSSYGAGPESDATHQEIAEATLTQGVWRGRVANQRADGSVVFVDLRTTLVRDESGEPVAMVGIGTDITERLRSEQALLDSQRQLADIIDFLPDALLAIDQDKRVIIWNKAIATMTGIPAAEMLGRGDYAYTIPFYGEPRSQLMDLVFMDDPALAACYTNIAREGDTVTAEAFCNALYHGRGAWIFVKISPLRDAGGQVVGAIEIIRDITARKRAEAALRQSQELFSLFMRHSPIYAYIKQVTPTDSRVLQASENFKHMVGIAGSEMVGKTMAELFPPDFAAKIVADDWQVVSEGREIALDEELDGRHYTTIKFPLVQDGQTLLAGYTIDITERKRLEDELRRLATQDPLTGLFNRRHFFVLAEQEYERFRRYRHPLALFMMDIDHFKAVNDRYGHLAGDEVLAAVAGALRNNLREVDILGRYGGEEFVALLPETDLETARTSAERLRAAIAGLRIAARDHTLSVTLSLGVLAIADGHPMPFELLLDAADRMLYRAKQAGRNRVEVWDVTVDLRSPAQSTVTPGDSSDPISNNQEHA